MAAADASFENLHRLDIVGVDLGKVASEDSVDDDQRFVAAIDGIHYPDPHRHGNSGCALLLVTPARRTIDPDGLVCGTEIREISFLYRRYGARQIAFPLRTVPYHYCLLQHCIVLGQALISNFV